MPDPAVAIVSGALTAHVRQGGALAKATPLQLARVVAAAAVRRSAICPEQFGHVFWGLMYQCEGDSVYLARHAALSAGLPAKVPATLTNRLCGSGLEAVVQGMRCIQVGEAQVVLAGSTDAISRAATTRLYTSGLAPSPDHNDPLHISLRDEFCGRSMAELAESFAAAHGITRAQLDTFTVVSRRRASRARDSGVFRRLLVKLVLPAAGASAAATVATDQLEGRWPAGAPVRKQPALFGAAGRLTRANTSAFADAAGALVLAHLETARRRRWPQLGKIRAWSIVAVDPAHMGEAMAGAIAQVLSQAGLPPERVAWYEMEEAFPAYCIHAARMLHLDRSKVNAWGGALAVGHAPATSGIRLLLSTATALKKLRRRFGLAALCIGGGQGMAVLLENDNCRE